MSNESLVLILHISLNPATFRIVQYLKDNLLGRLDVGRSGEFYEGPISLPT